MRMNSNTLPPDSPLDKIEKSNNETEKESNKQITDANTNKSKGMPQSFQNNHEGDSKNSEGENPNII